MQAQNHAGSHKDPGAEQKGRRSCCLHTEDPIQLNFPQANMCTDNQSCRPLHIGTAQVNKAEKAGSSLDC